MTMLTYCGASNGAGVFVENFLVLGERSTTPLDSSACVSGESTPVVVDSTFHASLASQLPPRT